MSDLNPTEIYRRYQRNELDKALAVDYLKSIIESSSNEELRVRSVELLGKMNLKANDILEFFENLLFINSSDTLKSEIITILYKNFRKICKTSLLTFFEGGASPDCLLGVYKALTNKKSEKIRDLINFIEETIGLKRLIKYDLIPKEAMALELLGRHLSTLESLYKRKEWVFNSIVVKDTRVFSIEIKSLYDKIKSKFFSLFSNLLKLRLYDCELEDYYNLENLSSLLITGTEEGHIDNIDDLKGLEALINLKELDLNGNLISEIKNLEKFKNLRILDLSENYINEIKGLESLVQLEVLNLEHNNLEEIKNLDNLTKLRVLNLSDNRDIPEIKGLRNLKSLEVLKLFNNFMINEIKGLEGLTNLRLLDISKVSFMIDKEGYEFILNVGPIYSEGYEIQDEIAQEIQDKIAGEKEEFRKSLEKYRSYIKEIKGLDYLTNLKKLFLEGNQITEIKGLENLEKLEVLDLRFNKIEEIKGLENLKRLKTLRLAGNKILPIEGLEGIENDLAAYETYKFVKYCKNKKKLID